MMPDVNASAVKAPVASAARPAHHQSPADLVAAGMALAILAVAQHASYASMLAVWHRSATFAHGYLILPISLWLIWRQRDSLLRLPRQPALTGLLLLGVLVLVWLLAAVANVSALMQYSATLMVAATVATVLGWRLTRAMAFPLAYLLLAVPFGEVLIPPMIEFTARFTVFALQCSGLPVFRDNNHLILSSGSWDVVEACSGLRYLMASLALGALFAHLNYHSNARKLAFLGVSLLLPVLANGVRAYLIVMLGHLSDMRLAAGVDHLIYGWLFFGLVSLLLFWCGALWRDAAPLPATTVPPPSPLAGVAPRQLAGLLILVLSICSAGPIVAAWLLSVPPAAAHPAPLTLADPPIPWLIVPRPLHHWLPPHAGHPQLLARSYTNGSVTVNLQLTWYPHQSRGAELLTPVTPPSAPDQPHWHEIISREHIIVAGGRPRPVRVSILQAGSEKLLVWRSYRLAGQETASPHRVKWLLALAKLGRQPDSGAEWALSCRFEEFPDDAAAPMQQLLSAMLPAIDEGLRHATTR